MALMEAEDASTIRFELHPTRSLALRLYSNVRNAAAVKKAIIEASADDANALKEATVVDPSLVVSALHVVAAANIVLSRVAAAADPGPSDAAKPAGGATPAPGRRGLKTRSVHLELIYCLSGSKSISDAMRSFGIGDASTSLLVAQFEGAEATLAPIEAIIEGERIPLSELASQDSRSAAGSSKAQRIAQHFKITDDELSVSSLEDAVVTRIATKEYF